MEEATFQEGVVGGKMNSEAINSGTLNNIFHGFCSN